MAYTMAELEELSGLSARTIRDYIRRGYVAKPQGRGPGASYDDEQMLRVVAIARMRADREGWDAIGERLASWSIAKLRAYVRRTDPQPAEPPAPAPSSASGAPPLAPPPQAPPPAAAPAATRHPEADTTTELATIGAGADAALPGGARVVMASVLPGLAILLNEDAAPLVKRIAAEILAKYRVTP